MTGPTQLAATKRYIAPGTRQYYWVATIASKSAPTRVELDAGTDLTHEVASVTGFTTTSNSVDAPDFGSRFTSKVPGMITADDSALNIYQSEDSTDARTLFTLDLEGFIVIFPEGDSGTGTPATKMDVFPVKVASVSKQQSDTDAAQMVVSFTITSQPVADIAVPST